MAAGEEIHHLTVFERDNWTCGLCGDPVDPNKRQPDPFCATIDHRTPISVCLEQGWQIEDIHTYANVQTAHLHCNLKKGGGVPLECDTIEPTER